jgi:hypothetical protein
LLFWVCLLVECQYVKLGVILVKVLHQIREIGVIVV